MSALFLLKLAKSNTAAHVMLWLTYSTVQTLYAYSQYAYSVCMQVERLLCTQPQRQISKTLCISTSNTNSKTAAQVVALAEVFMPS